MKPSTCHAHAARVDAVLARLQQALDQGEPPPGLDELAAVAHLSPFHFHRVWRALTGEALGRTVARLRLLRALHLLGDPASVATGVALASGYDSAQSLARAVRAALDVAPGDLRGDSVRIAEARLRIGDAAGPATAGPLQVEVVSLAPFEVVALRRRGAFDDLDAGFGRLFDWAAQAGLVESIVGLHGVPLGDHRALPPEQLEFECAISLQATREPPAPMRLMALGGGLHARVRHVGPYDRIEDRVDALLAGWWPGSGYALRDAPIHYTFLDDPETVPGAMLRADIHLPVQPR